ncbi:MAG TPA: DNA-processing protein DprA [Acidimicrobiia bacterium]|nr:DNA-processing protein DprA [Acidimicrobiia bacterium]
MSAPAPVPSPAALDDRRVAAAALACLPGIDTDRLVALFERCGDPRAALDYVRSGRYRPVGKPIVATWPNTLTPARLDALAARLAARGTHVWIRGDADYPIEPAPFDAPVVLFGEGDPTVLARPLVAIVGTRSASPHGLRDAHRLAEYLAGAGCTIVSGVALGIDGAAHTGALDAHGGTVGVVGTGLDIEYPRRHHALYRRLREHGLVVSEYGFGVPPEPYRFPHRNRIIATLARVTVVIEATVTGGARITADLAKSHGHEVFALPGSRRNPAALGCHHLIRDGVAPLVDPSDVLLALGITAAPIGWDAAPPQRVSPTASRLRRALAGEPATVDQAAAQSGLTLAEVAAAARELERTGALERRRGLLWPR